MKPKREHGVHLEAVSIRGWRALALRDWSQPIGRGVMLPREEVPWLVGEMGCLLSSPTGPVPHHIARGWGPLYVLVTPKVVRLWRRPGAWPIEGVGIAAAEARHVIEALVRDPS